MKQILVLTHRTLLVVCTGVIALLSSCTHDNSVIESAATVNSKTDLIALRVTTPPTIDGIVDAMWDSHPKLEFSTAVPEVTGDVFRGYTGNIIPNVSMRAAYDADNVYMIVQWSDPTKSLLRQPWYFNPTTKLWAQEKGTYDFDATTGALLRPPFYEDKIAFLWNINNSVTDWKNGTCYKSCHTGLPAIDGSSRHFTNFPSEKIDMWHWKSVRGGVNAGFQLHDQFQDNTYPNGRKGDVGGKDVYTTNSQTLNNGTTNVSVPKYLIPSKDSYGWIMDSEISSGAAKLVTAVDANGVLTLSDGTTIDPSVGTDFQRVGATVGPKAIPGVYLRDVGYEGITGDIHCKTSWSGGQWTLELQRKLNTGDAIYDVDFSSLADQYFGFAVFENAQIAHSIKTNLVLKFKK